MAAMAFLVPLGVRVESIKSILKGTKHMTVLDGRRSNGGARPGAGAPTKAARSGLQAALDTCVSQAEREQLWRNLLAQALDDNPKVSLPAITLLFAYVYGRPTEIREVSGSEGSPLEIVVRYAED
jgi:hypothetical protein